MKKIILLIGFACFISVDLAVGQDPEPACACTQPELVIELGGKLKLNYREMNVCTMDDGSLLLMDRDNEDYYIVKGGVTQGPFKEEDPRITGYERCYLESTSIDDLLGRYKGIVSKSGEKYLITMGGKNYGPFIEIADFAITASRNKFAAIAYDKDGEMPKLFTNIPNATFDIVNTLNAFMSGNIKYDEILIMTEDRVLNLQGKTVLNIKPDRIYYNVFLGSADNKFAYYDSENIELSDKTTLTEIFNPHLLKSGSTVYLAYMYYSPKRKAIMQCKIPF